MVKCGLTPEKVKEAALPARESQVALIRSGWLAELIDAG